MIKTLSSAYIEAMPYTDFIALIKETNRCPGGKDTIRKIIQNSFVDSQSQILEVGSNTGFTSLEIAHICKANIVGVDISESCVNTANELLKTDTMDVKKRVEFKIGSAYNLPFEDQQFDLVVTGGATSFMDNKLQAISEYKRVLKPWGFLSVTQLFYTKAPPTTVVKSVSDALGVEIKPWLEKDWKTIFESSQGNTMLEPYYFESNKLQSRSKQVIDNYIDYFMNKPHLTQYPEDIRSTIRKKWNNYINIFNENHNYLGYFIYLFRKPLYQEEPELFIKKNV